MIIVVFGIVNTLALSIFERTREISLLRALGMPRRTTRAMIRREAIIVALIGGAVGLVLGIFFGIVIVVRVRSLTTLSVPWTSLVIVLGLAGVAGVIAAIFPARRAARLDVLEANQTDRFPQNGSDRRRPRAAGDRPTPAGPGAQGAADGPPTRPPRRAVDVITHDVFMRALADLEADVARQEAKLASCDTHGADM